LYGHCDINNARRNSFKRLYIVKGLLVLVEKASFSKEFRLEFHSGGEGEAVVESLIDFVGVFLESEVSEEIARYFYLSSYFFFHGPQEQKIFLGLMDHYLASGSFTLRWPCT